MGAELFAVPFALSLVLLCVIQLIFHAVMCLVFRVSPWKQMAAQSVLVRLVEFVSSAGMVVTRTLVDAGVRLLGLWLLFITAFIIFSAIWVTYEEYPQTWLGFVSFYNANLGPFVSRWLVVPLQIADTMLRSLIPIYDCVVWWAKALLFQGLLPITLQEIQTIFKIASALLQFSKDWATASLAFTDSFRCAGDACLVPESRAFDLLSSLGQVREIVALGRQLAAAFCSALSAPLDALIFPLLDLNFSLGVHNLWNFLLQLTVVVPHVTYERCALAKNDTFAVMMCVPDAEPIFNYLVAALSSFGLAVDNWFNVILVIVQNVLSGTAPTCQSDVVDMTPTSFMESSVFAGNFTAVVGLTQWMYAVTDGYTAIYKGSDDLSVRAQQWPYAMDPSLGVAAVTYGATSDPDGSSISGGNTAGSVPTTAMLACNCSDTPVGVEILCAILPLGGVPPGKAGSSYLLQVLFPDEQTPAIIGRCAAVDISVHSNRFSATRFQTAPVGLGGSTASAVPAPDCATRGTCREVDATVYVVPRCGDPGNMACIGQCMPFCMAVRPSGSANNNLQLLPASRWRTGYATLAQDCALGTAGVLSVNPGLRTSGSSSTVTAPPGTLTQGVAAGVFAAGPTRACQPAKRVLSVQPRPGAADSIRAATRLPSQPLFTTGDTVFTERKLGGGASAVVVERLTSDDHSTFTLSTLSQDFPALATLDVQSEESTFDDPTRMLIPSAGYYRPVVAVSSRNYVFYAAPPALQCMEAYMEYCRLKALGSNELPSMGFLLTSSYAPIRVYRVSAYSQCAAYSCGPDLVSHVQFQGIDTRYLSSECAGSFNLSVARLEYLNEDNIAIVMQYSTYAEYDVRTGVANGTHSGYRTYWLNPPSMRVSTSIWDTSIPSSNYATLCPAMQRLPRVGTFAAEVLNAGVFLVRWAVNAILYTPGMVPIWRAGGACPAPAASHRHSMLMHCGQTLFSLDDFFDSLDDADAVLWHGLSVVAQLVGTTAVSNTGSNPVADFLRGMEQYGYAAVDAWSARSSVIRLLNFPIAQQIDKTMAVLTNSPGSALGVLGGALKVNVATIAWARFGYKAVSEVALTIAKASLAGSAQTSQQIWQAVWATLYDLQSDYDTIVTDRNLMACGGIQLMMGLDNPWAGTLYGTCAANAQLYSSALRMAMDVFVHIPMVKCVCKDASGQNARDYVENTCAPNLPVTLRPTLYMIVNQLQGLASANFKQLACSAVVDDLKASMQGELDPVFESFEFAAESLANLLDYTLTPWDSDGGHCLDFETDPHVVVIVPEPVDYFSKCADTSDCHAVCAAEWSAFQSANSTPVDLPTISFQTESFFFPGAYDSSIALSNATTVTEVDGAGICVDRGAGVPADYCLAIAQFGAGALAVRFYCVPQVPGETVYPAKGSSTGFGPFTLPGDIMDSAFMDDTGLTLALLLRVKDLDAVYLMAPAGLRLLPTFAPLIPKDKVLVRTVSMWPIEGGLVVDAIVRSFQGTAIVGSVMNFRYDLSGNQSVWRPTSVDLSPYANQYWFVRLSGGQYLLLPRILGLAVYTVEFAFTTAGFTSLGLIPVRELSQISFQGGLAGTVLADRSLRPSSLFAVTPSGWNWLVQLRLQGTATAVYASTPVTTNMNQHGHCDSVSCEGCPSLSTNRLCHAYNKCALTNCVGTPVNLKRPLCGLGGMLRTYATLGMQSFQGGWRLFVELLMLVISLASTPSAGVDISFPEDQFMGYVCSAKSLDAHKWSVLTSALNSALNLGHANVGFMYHGASNVDTNADAMLTILMATVTKFMSQLSSLPLYMMLVTHQIYICQTNGELALVDATGYTLRIQSATLSDATSNVVGQCLTVGDATLARYSSSTQGQLGYKVGSTLQNAFNLLLLRQIEPFLHILDGTLAYYSGVISAMGEVIMAQFAAQCNPPDIYLSDVVKCACGDSPLAIPAAQASQTWQDYALWCSGTLSMVDGTNNPFVVYNPYSYAQLQAMAGGMQAYVDCASQSYQCSPPSDKVFAMQGVTLLNVLIKCRENFVENQWDPAAYVLFDPKQRYRYKSPTLVRLPADTFGVQACLLSQANAGASNAPCLDQYLSFQTPPVDYYRYWAYERALPVPPATTVPAQRVDACLTFSGPAAQGIPVFQNCVDDETQDVCTLSGHAWSPTSNNSIPIGQSHAVLYHGRQTDSLIVRLYNEAYAGMRSALDAAIAHWSVDQQDVSAKFFSAEGDLIHQTLDCIFMGPYARVDYWPLPSCGPGEECLAGPYWSRDPDGGKSRGVDPYSCVTVDSLPYTCGSPGRQSLTRYFVNTFLTQGSPNSNTSVFQKAVLAQLLQINATWTPPSFGTYGCVCPDGNQSQTCCAGAGGSYFPPNLIVNTETIAPGNVLNAIDEHFDTLYTRALEHQDSWVSFMSAVAPGELTGYDWSGSRRAADEARFDPKHPVYEYAPREAMSPLLNTDATLWDICHSSLKQVFWTLPIVPENNTIVFDGMPYDGDASGLEAYIQGLVADAALKSPLFRHYLPRHAPSDSLVCVPDPDASPDSTMAPDGAAGYNDYVHQTSTSDRWTVLQGSVLGTFPAYDYRRFALGAAMCPCGWDSLGPLCEAPSEACAAIQGATGRVDCLFWPDNASLVLDLFQPAWPCPEFEVSPHWGLLDPASNEQWLQGQTALSADARDLLQYGRTGLRAGGLDTLRANSKATINPTARRVPVERARLTTCRAGERLVSRTDLADGFVDELFPMAQGVEEAGAVAHCLRYVMEVARMQALGLVAPDSYDASAQAQTVARWRQRCGAQLQLLNLCVNLDVFRAPDTTVNFFGKTCHHFAASSGPSFYTTPECLANIDGVFYDPCRCMPCVGNTSTYLDANYLQGNPACRLRFDPRRLVRAAPVGWWATDEPGGAEANAYLSDLSSLLVDDFAQQLANDSDAAGNTLPGGPSWWSAEGPMDQCSQDCDMIADWWPDDWDYPVGFHVTVPCDAEDAAYRTFHQAFGYSGTDSQGVPVLTYEHDTLRDANLVDQNFGVGGLCRSTSWGMETFATNTMRYCTRTVYDEHEDYTVYWPPGQGESAGVWGDWSCATSAQQLPWPDSTVSTSPNTGTHESNLYSVGTVPNMPQPGDDYYPEDLTSGTYEAGPWQEILADRGWGSRCSDYPLQPCATLQDCPSDAYLCRGRFCRNSYIPCQSNSDCNGTGYGACEGVCIDKTVDCIRHSDCAGGMMCTGLGACVTPLLTVQNKVPDDDFAFQVSAKNATCPAESRGFSMLGSSYWAYVTNDILRIHGMCSYGDWFKYHMTLANCAPVDHGDYLGVDPTKCQFIDLDSQVLNTTHWWEYSGSRPQVMYMHPSNCDKDYERLQGYRQCAPASASIRVGGRDVSSQMAFDQYVKMHMGDSPSQGGVTIPLAKMRYSGDPKFGFIGIDGIKTENDLDGMFETCSNLDQCTPPPFFSRGKPAKRQMFFGNSWTPRNYSDADTFKCGVIGYSNGDHCELDLAVTQLYRFLCLDTSGANAQCVSLIDGLPPMCESVSQTYPAGYAGVAANVKALNALLYAITQPTDLATYLDTTDCMQALHAYLNRPDQLYPHPYFALDFVLFEISFDWFYQCIVLRQTQIDETARYVQDCPAYSNRAGYSISSYTPRSVAGDDAMTMLRFVRGGYTRANVMAYWDQHLSAARTALNATVNRIINQVYGGEDQTVPRCSTVRLWKFDPKYQLPHLFRAIIDTWYTQDSCKGTWLDDQVRLAFQDGWGLNSYNWYQIMTTFDVNNVIPDPQWDLPDSLLDEIQNFIISQIFVRLANRVMGGNPGAPGVDFLTRSEAVVLNNKVPPVYAGNLPSQLDPSTPAVIYDNVILRDDPNVPQVCIYDDFRYDPQLQNVYSPATCAMKLINRSYVTDQLMECPGPVYCTSAPIYYSMNGVYNCQYYPPFPGAPCDSSQTGCGTTLLNALYSEIARSYVPEDVKPLPPSELPWFMSNETWGFTFDLTQTLDYLGNIMPNKEKTIMCTIDTGTPVDLMNCTNPHYQTLKDHVKKYYKYNGSVIVPRDGQLDWVVDQAFLTSGAIYSYASTNRDLTHTFVDALFDDQTVCKGDTSGDQRVCWRATNGTTYKSVNPWMLGYWNPYIECDVDFTGQTQTPVETINAGCSSTVCPPDSPYYRNMPFMPRCTASYGLKVSQPGVPQIDVFANTLPYNLCFHKLQEDQVACLHDQALLGGSDGMTIGAAPGSTTMTAGTRYEGAANTLSPDMYTPSSWEIPNDFLGGLFDDTNPLWAGNESIFGFLRVPPAELGIHRIGLQITRDANSSLAKLDVYKLPLGVDGDGLDLDSPTMASLPVQDWVPTLLASIHADSDMNLLREGSYNRYVGSNPSPSCPLRRYAFYSSNRPQFAPSMPSPQRANHLFGNITGRAFAHPTMNHLTTGEFLGQYTTVNGFCFCPVVQGIEQAHCKTRIGASADQCSLTQTVQALTGQGVITSMVFPPRTSLQQDLTCTMPLDWPKLPIALRDGSPGPSSDEDFKLASDQAYRKCHVLDRLNAFQYQYQSVPEFPSPGPHSYLDGVCQTRRATQLLPETRAALAGKRCVRDALESGQAYLRCAGQSGRMGVPRPAQQFPPTMVNNSLRVRRTRCDACSPPPRFVTSAGAGMPPESSFGRPFRLSAERMMAKDLRDAVCGGSQDCPILNRSAWRAGEFMANFLFRPASLFVGTSPDPPARQASPGLDDSARWTDHGWVYCPDRQSLRTGKGCLGSMPRDVWQSSKTSACPHMVRSLSSNGSHGGMAPTPFFNIDRYTEAVNVAYANAIALVSKANCIAAGNFSCLPRPWVYHPSSFVPSNQEWAYKSVLDYYRLVSATACPMTDAEKNLTTYNQRFMQGCPANTMRFFVDVLAIVRLVATDLAYIFTTFVSMGVKFVTLLFSGADTGLRNSISVAQQEIAADWLWIKKEARSMLAGINQLLLDMVFTTGEIGKMLLGFLTDVCGFVNQYYSWFLGVWCKYFQTYLTGFLTKLRKGLSMISTGFEILQDFMDATFQGVLPAAFIEKYGDKLFQRELIEKYSQPTARKSKYLKNVESNMRMYTSTMSRVVKYATKVTDVLESVRGPLGYAATVLSLGLTGYEAYNTLEGALLYPSNFTLFDFSGVFDGIDEFTMFLTSDETCLEYKVALQYGIPHQLFSCFDNTLLNNPALSNLAATSIMPTLCWAQAQVSLGQSNLFSCHSGSTCCPDDACETPIVCDQCPAPQFEGEARYACNTLRQQCQCAVLEETYTPCTSNQQCSASSQCMLASLASAVSYGTIPCGSCQTLNVFCVIPPSGYPGQCTCYTDNSMPKALCSDTSGTSTAISGTRLCGYSAASSPSDTVWQFAMDQLAMVPCLQATTAICSTVWLTPTSNIMVAVAIPPLKTASRRRLLWEDGPDSEDPYAYDGDFEPFGPREAREVLALPGWDATAAPCAELVRTHNAGAALGPLERHELHRCAYWRFVGRRVVATLNLTGLAAHDTFLLSAEDLAAALSHQDALLELVTAPWAFVYALMYHPWLRPLRAIATVLANTLERTDWLRQWLETLGDDDAEEQEELLDFVTGEGFESELELERQGFLNWSEWRTELRARRLVNPRRTLNESIPKARVIIGRNMSIRSRSLLSVISDIQLVQAMSASISSGGDTNPPVPQQVAQAWGAGPFVWPPRYEYGAGACPVGVSVVDITSESLTVLVLYYANWDHPVPPIDRSFRAALPQISLPSNRTIALARWQTASTRARTWASAAFHYVTEQVFGLQPADIVDFFSGSGAWSLDWLVVSLTQCDLAAAVSCSRHKRDLIMSIVVFVLLYTLIQWVGAATGLSILSTAFFYGSPLLLLWYVYGVAPSCFPVLPTCLVSDLVAAMQYVAPGTISLPAELLCDGANATCLRPCADLNFTSWADTLAFAVCDTDAGWCGALAGADTNGTFSGLLAPFQDALHEKHALLTSNATTASLIAACRVCAWVTWISVLPALFLLIAIVLAAGSIITSLVLLGPSFFALVAQAWAFHRTPGARN